MKMFISKWVRLGLACILLFLVLSFFPHMAQAAPKLSQKKVTLQMGESVKIKVNKGNMYKRKFRPE